MWGKDELFDRLADGNNHAFIAELESDPEFAAWVGETGLTFAEVARVHAPAVPAYTGPRDTGGGGRPAGPSSPGPGGPSSPGPAGPSSPGPSGPSTPDPPSYPGAPPTYPVTPGGDYGPVVLPQEAWWQWWEFNKLHWLGSNRIAESESRASSSDDRTVSESYLQVQRRELVPVFFEHLEHRSPVVRGAAAITLGRLARETGRQEEVVDRLREMLDDPHTSVRHNAILALGATGANKAISVLMPIARYGSPSGRGTMVAPAGRPLAVLALALACQQDADPSVLRSRPDLSLERERLSFDWVASALMMHHTLLPSDDLARVTRDVSGLYEKREAEEIHVEPGVASRARAIETLRFDDPADVLPRVLRMLGDKNVELRRSAALTLGSVQDERALQPLMTDFEFEEDPLTRGFLLIAIGRQGGAEARDFLIHNLKKGPKATRPWTALGLGVLAFEEDDDEARKAIRSALAREKNRDTRGAYLLAAGIGQDPEAVEEVRHELLMSKSPRDRMLASISLALIGEGNVRANLRKAIKREKSVVAQSGMAQGLASLGDPEDAEILVGLLGNFAQPAHQAQVAAALGAHGTRESLFGLVEMLADDGLPNAARAACVQSLGVLLDREPPFTFAAISQDANFAVFPGWVVDSLLSSL